MQLLDDNEYQLLRYWLPAISGGLIAWALFLLLGQTPLVRASGLALVIVAMGLALRRMGSGPAIVGSLTLAFSPVFWSQTGGGEGDPATIVIAIAAAAVAVILGMVVIKRPAVGIGLGIVVFVLLFWSQIGTPRSLRLTGFAVSWLLFLLIDMLLLTNPRPNEAIPPILRLKRRDGSENLGVQPYHTLGILLLLGLGILNDPLLTLLTPAVVLALYLSRLQLPLWYWILVGLIAGIGLRGLAVDYIETQGHFINLMGWRDGARWVDLVQLVVGQFSIFGIILGVLGLARLARWYPPLGLVTMTAYAAYTFFALVYDGPNQAVLTLPLFIIQVTWMSYAVFTLGEWAAKSLRFNSRLTRQLVYGLYALIPIFMLVRIVS